MAKQKHDRYTTSRIHKGRGILKCVICGAPYSKHKLGPCPFALEGELQHKPTLEKQRMDR